MKKLLTISLLLICTLSVHTLAQYVTMWRGGTPTVEIPDSLKFLNNSPMNADGNSVAVWSADQYNVYNGIDSLSFWMDDFKTADIDEDLVLGEQTETELYISQLPNDEDEAPMAVYSQEDSLKYDELARELIELYDTDDEASDMPQRLKRSIATGEETAEDIIAHNGENETDLIIIQEQNDAGRWGKTRYGGFKTFFKATVENGKRYLFVAFYCKGGFPNNKKIYLKVGQVNCGKIPTDGHGAIKAGQERGFLKVEIDESLPANSRGLVNFFPLIINAETGARNYLNPYLIKTKALLPSDWRKKDNGYEFGKINGVSVFCNTSYDKYGNVEKWNEGLYKPDGKTLWEYQCVNLCARYTKNQYKDIKRGDRGWSNAYDWHTARANDDTDPDRYVVFPNDGREKVRQGDYIIWDYPKDKNGRPIGHIAVVVNVNENENYISVAHQNGGAGQYADPIGTTLKYENGKIYDVKPGKNKSPIFAVSHNIDYFIRVKGRGSTDFETYEPYTISMKVDRTSLDFKPTEVGQSSTMTFTVTTTSPDGLPLKIESVSLSNSHEFSTDLTPCEIPTGSSQSFHVTYTPKSSGARHEYLILKSNAADNKTWRINLNAESNSGNNGLVLSATQLDIAVGSEETVTVTGGSGNYSVRSGNPNMVSAVMQGDKVILKGLAPGTTRVRVKDESTKQSAIIRVTINDNKELMLNTTVDGVNYRIYKEVIDKNDVHVNNDGHRFYRSALTLVIDANGVATTYTLDTNIYLDMSEQHHGGQRPCMLLNFTTRQIWVFCNSKNNGGGYSMDGYAYRSSMNNFSFQRESVFDWFGGYPNCGWSPYFIRTENGQPAIAHFNYAGYYAMQSSRNSDGTWSTEYIESIYPDEFEQRSLAAGDVLVIR